MYFGVPPLIPAYCTKDWIPKDTIYVKFKSKLFNIECSNSLSLFISVRQYNHDRACCRHTLSLVSWASIIASFKAAKASSL